ncbi:MAG: hypothetical protein COV76_06930 [Candidatus Omnitrophica bacterium CG11_big_fil_rev_8_21_14_0_20_64_10]|nr:MAG: hypothetical protein COV76_06930 [Candidatus Omnitrophica bacterium CG11_big_fil_rev_8_21_14_0_20_64_10]
MLAKVESAAVVGLTGVPITVEVDVSGGGLPGLHMVGLPDPTIREAKERLRSAIRNSAFAWPASRITVNLAPADVRKEGSAFDLPMAVGVLAASGQFPAAALERTVLLGELALDGQVRGLPGILPVALSLSGRGKRLLVPAANAAEAALAPELTVVPMRDLAQAVRFLQGLEPADPVAEPDVSPAGPFSFVDYAEVRGQGAARRALEVAAAGGHNLLLIGPPGVGKTMLVERLPTILPPMSPAESLEVTMIHSAAGLLPSGFSQITGRPFRHPHHTASAPALIGGGTIPRPGEVSLAHHGVLFLDELPEFDRAALEGLRQPLEAGRVTVVRTQGSCTFPARVMLVAAMNPCPCGFAGDPRRGCVCTPSQFIKYRSKMSGPLLDRIDLQLEVPAVRWEEMTAAGGGESSAAIRSRVEQARRVQRERFKAEPGCFVNGQMSHRQVRRFCRLTAEGREILGRAVERLGLSARAHDRVLRVARTIADLEGTAEIEPDHLAEAVQYRCLDRPVIESNG